MKMIFSEGRIGALRLPNRLIRSATAERRATPEGMVTDALVTMYRELALGGAGLIIAGHSYVRADGKAGPTMTGLHCDETVPGWRRVIEAVHAAGGLIAAQINHGGRQAPPALVGVPRAPSAVPLGETTPHPLTDAEIEELIGDYAAAARRAVEAGFDAIQIHAAHGYLLASFHSPFTNRRQDRWGGDWRGRSRMTREVIRAVRRQIGSDYPLLMKLNASDGIAGGITREEAVLMAADFAAAGLDAIEISGGSKDAPTHMARTVRPGPEEAYFAADARPVRAAVSVPVITVGGIRSWETANRLIEDGTADFVALCRPFIREPALPKRWLAGDLRPATCISCNLCSKYPERALRCEVLVAEGAEGKENTPS